MSYENLEQALRAAKSPVEMLRNSQIGPYAFPVVPSGTMQRSAAATLHAVTAASQVPSALQV